MEFKFKDGTVLEGRLMVKGENVYIIRVGTSFYLVNKHVLLNNKEDGEAVCEEQE